MQKQEIRETRARARPWTMGLLSVGGYDIQVLRAMRFLQRAFGAVYIDDDDDGSVNLKMLGVDVLINKPDLMAINKIISYMKY